MKLLIESWRRFLKEEDEPMSYPMVVRSREELIKFVLANPDQERYVDAPKGSRKAFGTEKDEELPPLPFEYGEWPELKNPSDDMGWDLIIVPSAKKSDMSLVPIGYVAYNEKKPHKQGNDKIIIGPPGGAFPEDEEIINDFFNNPHLDFFDAPVWL